MEAQAPQSPLELLAEKRPIDCKDAIKELSPDELKAILEDLVDLVKEGTPDEKNIRLLENCIMFFPQEDVFEFLQRLRTGELLQQFCRFFDGITDFNCLVRMSKILLTKSENDFLRQILTILNEKRYMDIPIGIHTLRFLKDNICSLIIQTTLEVRKKILNFLISFPDSTLKAILKINDEYGIDIWNIKTREFLENYSEPDCLSE